MVIHRKLLAIIGRRNPAYYDVIPRGPLGLGAAVALNPQPLPPAALGAAMAGEFMQATWMAERGGLDPGVLQRILEDWCPTYPRRPKLPPWWPPIPEPDPQPDWFTEFHLGFASRLAAVSPEGMSGRTKEYFDKALEQSLGSLEKSLG
jgi:hypothetical protein